MKDEELERLERAYRELGATRVPWYFPDPPGEVMAAIDRLAPRSARILELGCGTGVLARALATRGHTVLAVDAVLSALTEMETPRDGPLLRAAADVRVPCWGTSVFDLIVDWELLHHIPYGDRGKFFQGVARALRPGRYYLSASFACPDRAFAAPGPIIRTPLGTVLYLTNPFHLPALLEPWFEILELRRTVLRGHRSPHDGVWLLAKRRREG